MIAKYAQVLVALVFAASGAFCVWQGSEYSVRQKQWLLGGVVLLAIGVALFVFGVPHGPPPAQAR